MTGSTSTVYLSQPGTIYEELGKFMNRFIALKTTEQIERLSKLNMADKNLIETCRDAYLKITKLIVSHEIRKNDFSEFTSFGKKTFEYLTNLMNEIEGPKTSRGRRFLSLIKRILDCLSRIDFSTRAFAHKNISCSFRAN